MSSRRIDSSRGRRPGRLTKQSLSELMEVLVDDQRRRIFAQVARQPAGMQQLTRALKLPPTTLENHLRRLQLVNLVRREGAGRRARYRIGGCVTTIAGRDDVYIRVAGRDGAEAILTIPHRTLDS